TVFLLLGIQPAQSEPQGTEPSASNQSEPSKEELKYLRDRIDKLQEQAASKDDIKRLDDDLNKFVTRDEYKAVTTLAWATVILAIILSVWNAASIMSTWKHQGPGSIPPAPAYGPVFPQATPAPEATPTPGSIPPPQVGE
ncbi:MAG: hypothetical protein U1D69_14940, partial [Polynucleobacter sp.]|nr:hypothetical protein [Polynucleobacter sp.]